MLLLLAGGITLTARQSLRGKPEELADARRKRRRNQRTELPGFCLWIPISIRLIPTEVLRLGLPRRSGQAIRKVE